MVPPVRFTPEGYHAVTAGLVVRRAPEAIDFYRRAFGARELFRLCSFDGRRIVHAELVIGDSRFFVMDEEPLAGTRAPAAGGKPAGYLRVYVPDVDLTYQRALAAGAKTAQPPTEMFFGDRCARVLDPDGHEWMIATHREDLTPKEKQHRLDAQSQ